MSSAHKLDAVIVGAGASGLLCAAETAKRGKRVALLEHSDRIGKKILISGGGRCNFTNIYCKPENFISENQHFAKSALARYAPADFIALVQKYKIPYHEKTLGQLFCDGSATEIVDMLESECRNNSASIFVNTLVREVRKDSEFILRTDSTEFRAPVLVIASGGLSIPKMGATSFGYGIAQQFGIKIIPTRPALVPFVLNAGDRQNYCDLAGLSAEVVASIGRQSFREKMLITHRGLSGPAILQISSYWKKGQALRMDLAPGVEVTAAIRQANVRNLPAARGGFLGVLPRRFADRWLQLHEPPAWRNQALDELERQAHEWELTPADTEGYEKAEVTAGGVDTDELSSKTMESRKVPGLFFIGEVVDVTGHLGGFNFQWAWASAVAAANAI